MSWLYRFREGRYAQRDADRLDALLSTPKRGAHGPGSAPFRRELAAAQAIAGAVETEVEPPDAARVALRAGLSMQRRHVHRRPAARAGFALATMAAAAVGIFAVAASSDNHPRPTTIEQSVRSLDELNKSVDSLEQAVATGDKTVIIQRIASAQAAVQQAKSQAAALPPSSRALALTVTNRSSDEIQWLATQGQVTEASVAPSSTTAAPNPTTTRAPSGPTTTVRRPTTTTSTAPASTTTTPASTTTAAPTTTTAAPAPSGSGSAGAKSNGDPQPTDTVTTAPSS